MTKQCKYHSGTISADQHGSPNPYPGYLLLKAGKTKNDGLKIFYNAMFPGIAIRNGARIRFIQVRLQFLEIVRFYRDCEILEIVRFLEIG